MKKRNVYKGSKPILCLLTVCCILILSMMSGSALDFGSVRLTVRQVFDSASQDPGVADTFEYCLVSLDDGAPMPLSAENGEYRFSLSGSESFAIDEIRFTDVGQYHYQLRQLIDEKRDGYTYDEKVFDVIVMVTNTDGGLEVNTCFLNKDGYKEPELLFTNSFSDSQTVAKDHLTAKKLIEGSPAKKESFVFHFKPASTDCPMPAGSDITGKTLTVQGAGSFDIGEIEFSTCGVYRYTLFEEDTGAKDYLFDKTVYSITYTVVTEDSRFVIRSRAITADGVDTDHIVFKNVYTAPAAPTTPTEAASAEREQASTDAVLPTAAETAAGISSSPISSIIGKGKTDSSGSGPKTGDPIDFVIIISVMAVALIVLLFLLFSKKKDDDEKDVDGKTDQNDIEKMHNDQTDQK